MGSYYLRRVEVNNLKSFRDRFAIVFGPRVTAVTSKDAADKSSLFKAIGLALGERTLSGQDADNGVYNNLFWDKNKPGFVTLTVGKLEDDSYEKRFSTKIVFGNSRTYEINGQIVTKSGYEQALKAVTMNAHSNLLLYFRRQFEAIASDNSKDFGKFFEETCCDSDVVIQYVKSKVAFDRMKEKVSVLSRELRGKKKKEKQVQTDVEYASVLEELRRKHDNVQIQSNLFDFYHYNGIIADVEPSYFVAEENLESLRCKLSTYEVPEELVDLVGTLSERVKERQNEANAYQLRLKGLRNDLDVLPKKIEKLEELKAKCSARIDAHQNNVVKLNEAEKEHGECRPNLKKFWLANKAILEEYETLKPQAMKISGCLMLELINLRQKKTSLSALLMNSASIAKAVEMREAAANRIRARQQKGGKEFQDKIEKAECQISNLNKKLKADEELVDLNARIEKLSNQVYNAKRNKEAADAVDALKKNHIQTVFGRFVDLCQAKDAKYNVAVAAVLNRYGNAIIVDTQATEDKCTELLMKLKDKKLGQQTFWPLDKIEVPLIKENLRNIHLPRNVLFLEDVVQYQPEAVKNAVLLATRNILVCETLADFKKRKELSRLKPLKNVQVATLDGKYYGDKFDETREEFDYEAKLLDDAAIKTLTKELKKLKKEKGQCQPMTGLAKLDLSLEKGELETEIKKWKASLAEISSPTNVPSLPKAAASCLASRNSERADLERIEVKIKIVEDKVKDLEKDVWRGFCAKFGFSDFEDFQNKVWHPLHKIDGRDSDIEIQIAALKLQIEKDKGENLNDKDKWKELNSKFGDCCSELERLKSGEPHLKNKLKDALITLQKCKAELAVQQSQLDDLIFERTNIQNEIAIEKKKANEMELSLNEARGQRHLLLLNCKDNSIAMPIIQGDLEQVTLFKKDLTQEDHFVFDYSSLPQRLMEMTSEQQIKKEKDKFQEKLKEMREWLEKPSDQNEDLQNAQKDVAVYLQIHKDVKKRFNNLKKDYEAAKFQRSEEFMRAFESVASIIDGIYKELTGDAMASASLILEKEEEPYLGGIQFLCIAPNATEQKRIHELPQADQTIAALALSFAIQSIQDSPLMVLADIDSELEAANIIKVANFLRGRRGQTVFFTSNEATMVKSDELIRICKETRLNAKKIFKLDLSKYRNN